ncbi:TadE/TadG family type IV pilus assembly protein [Methylobacterium sp. J-077]|uniref:TadE/TadG family type IV pilus assembly protein n=1 Tax=Methylobacterium sp. J-077 TaxID=2836656 RepID=UPI001FB898EA|nr:TadE/TadG family type IV pilus assembly protein [Methylobacterium sp. J-077]MCJ2125757.1 pilus assembly protein [Methylobacterium sp. J-077]
MIQLIGRFRRDRRGIGAVEFALILPIMLTAVLGSVQCFLLARAKMLTVAAARNLADLVSQQDSVNATTISDFCTAGQLSIQPLPSTTLKVAVASVSYSSTTSAPAIVWTDVTCGSVATITSAAKLAAAVVLTTGDSAIVVCATYTLSLPVSFPLGSSFALTGTAIARPRNGSAVTYGS